MLDIVDVADEIRIAVVAVESWGLVAAVAGQKATRKTQQHSRAALDPFIKVETLVLYIYIQLVSLTRLQKQKLSKLGSYESTQPQVIAIS